MSRSPSVLLVAALAAAAVAVAACSSGSDAAADRSIVGTWSGTVNETEQAYTFDADGSFHLAYTNHADDGTYETSGDAIAIHITSGRAGGLPVVADDRYTGTFAIAADGESMTLTLLSDPPPPGAAPTVCHLQRR